METIDAPSPFIPGTKIQFAWDSTSLGLLKECPRKYQLTIIDGWRSKGNSVHLDFGLLFHKALENFDIFKSQGSSPEEALFKTIKTLLEDSSTFSPDHKAKTRENLLRSVIWYLETYKDDPSKTLILANGKPAVELSFRFDSEIPCTETQNYILSGHMDRLIEFGDQRFVMDRKTTGSTLGGYYFDQYNPDNQMTLYTLASRIVYDMPVAGVMIDAAQVAIGFTAFSRGITMRSNNQLNEWMGDFTVWMNVAKHYAEIEHWPMNEKSCNNYGGCVFKKICNKDPIVRLKFLETDFEIRHWNPLEVR